MEKTIREWFEDLPTYLATLAANETYKLNKPVLRLKVESLPDAIVAAFSWAEARGGYHFWELVHDIARFPQPQWPGMEDLIWNICLRKLDVEHLYVTVKKALDLTPYKELVTPEEWTALNQENPINDIIRNFEIYRHGIAYRGWLSDDDGI